MQNIYFGKWKISRELGNGSFGRVYEIYWDDNLGGRTYSALKIIHIPEKTDLSIKREELKDEEAVRDYFFQKVRSTEEEIEILKRCKGNSHIVSYEDHQIRENPGEEGIGWDILIRTELLYSIRDYFSREDATQYDVVRMWLEISKALAYCHKEHILHMDLKPGNILVSERGLFKLSDFGAASGIAGSDSLSEADFLPVMRSGDTASAIKSGRKVGTERYMPPEMYNDQKYDERSDLYSLGCVIYYFLNRERHLFLPSYPQKISREDHKTALEKRTRGDRPPKIREVPAAVNKVLLRSVSWNPDDRYENADMQIRAIRNMLKKNKKKLQKNLLHPHKKKGSFLTGERGAVLWPAFSGILLLLILGIYISDKNTQETRYIMEKATEETPAEEETGVEGEETETGAESEIEGEETAAETGEPAPADGTVEQAADLPIPASDTNFLACGHILRPQNGEYLESETGISAWFMADVSVPEEPEVSVNFISEEDGNIFCFETDGVSEMEDELFLIRKEQYKEQISAAAGWEIRDKIDIRGLPEGGYQMDIKVCFSDAAGVIEEINADSTHIFVRKESTVSSETDVTASFPAAGPEKIYLDEEKGVQIILLEEENLAAAGQNRFVFSGTAILPEGSDLSAILNMDGKLYTRETIRAEGGEITVIRGETRPEDLEIHITAPFLTSGEHMITLLLNLSFSDGSTEVLTEERGEETGDGSVSP